MYFCNMDIKYAITTLDSTKTTIKVKVGDIEYEMLLNKFLANVNTINAATKYTSTATGATSATINDTSGIVTFTAPANPGINYYILSNSSASATSVIQYTLDIASNESAALLNGGYSLVGSDIYFTIYNASVNPSIASFKINFEIVK